MSQKILSTYHASIGIIGHVDHGKTTLIHALTGILTAREHEQKCGMTQDLGFAYFCDPQGNNIGIVDVPGHERYIRNMVSGIANLNAVILVISATEGWMPMTTDHVQIAQALGQTNIIICINKSDLVSEKELLVLEEIVLERLMDMTDIVPDIVCVSARTKKGIDLLKNLIIKAVSTSASEQSIQPQCPDNKENSIPARLYIDRSFTIKGIGTVVTGTLAQGTLNVNDKVYIASSSIKNQQSQAFKVRSLQSYHQQCDTVQSISRVAICLKGVKRKDIKRGDCLMSDASACEMTDQLIVRLSDSIKFVPKLKSYKNIEISLGSWHGYGQLIYLKDTNLVRLKLSQPAPVYFGQPIALIRHGGSTLIHGGFIVWTSEVTGFLRRKLYHVLNTLSLPIKTQQCAQIQFSLRGYIERKDIASNAITSNMITHQQWLLDKQWLETQTELIKTHLFSANVAMGSAELSQHLHLDIQAIEVLTQYLKTQKVMHLSYAKWVLGDGDSEDDLSADAQSFLSIIRDKGKAGFELSKEDLTTAEKAQLRNLARLKYIVHIEGDIYYDQLLYRTLIKAIIATHVKGDRINMNDIKERSGLSRKYAIPLANRMQQDGWVRRQENERIILKAYSEETLIIK
ncbi:selenocysteine-specific translation elongation factor [Psychromonas sp. CNPT3]|uniref:selenocysteine-specific translation elongation factor n=1 Tax=Psychromonas sp. CNPT3 TaxID=314282 RepID=UPI0002C0A73D|nr:selenocysteine-specific translation elongation factor [Psychromonas sp. CNPT3]AGH82376.1 selenocysteine-specific translation elongation factor [Psychromonas sp. CNPT3]